MADHRHSHPGPINQLGRPGWFFMVKAPGFIIPKWTNILGYGLVKYIYIFVGMSENVEYTPNEIAIGCRGNDQQNHWVQWGLAYFQTNPNGMPIAPLTTLKKLRSF